MLQRHYLFLYGVLVVVFLAFVPFHVFAASLSISPATKTVSVGQTFGVAVEVSSPDQAMNAASGDLSFPTNQLEVLSVSKSNSIISLWVSDPSFSNSIAGGDVHFEGVVLNPGFIGTAGTVVQVTFRAIAPGSASISFSNGSVLANDGNGTNILTNMQSGSVTIVPAAAPAPTPTPTPTPKPSVVPAQATTDSGPANFTIIEAPNNDPTDPQPIFSWNAQDSVSGIAHYLVKIGDGDLFDASSIRVPSTTDQYQLPLQAPMGNVPLVVEAVSGSGITTVASTSFSVTPLPAPTITNYPNQLSSMRQTVSIAGIAPHDVTVLLSLKSGNTTLALSAPVDDNGNWAVSQTMAIAPGLWTLGAQAVDARGAMSAESSPVTIVVTSWLNNVLAFLGVWGLVILLILLIAAALIAFAYFLVHRMRVWHITSERSLVKMREELRADLKRIEREMGSGRAGTEIDLSASGMKKKQERARKEIEHLEEDLEKDEERLG